MDPLPPAGADPTRRRFLVFLLGIPLVGGCLRMMTRQAINDQEIRDDVLERIVTAMPQLGIMPLSTAFYLNINEMLCGETDLDADEESLAQVVTTYLLGETTGYTIRPHIKDQPLIYGEGHMNITGYFHTEGKQHRGAILDSFGNLVSWFPTGEALEIRSFTLRSCNQVTELKAGVVAQYFELLPDRSSYNNKDVMTRNLRDTVFQLNALAAGGKKNAPGIDHDFARYLSQDRGPLGPLIKVDFLLRQTPNGTFYQRVAERYPTYVRLPSKLISSRLELERGVEKFRRRDPARVREVEGGIELRLGYAAFMPMSTGHRAWQASPNVIGHRKDFAVPDFPARPVPAETD